MIDSTFPSPMQGNGPHHPSGTGMARLLISPRAGEVAEPSSNRLGRIVDAKAFAHWDGAAKSSDVASTSTDPLSPLASDQAGRRSS